MCHAFNASLLSSYDKDYDYVINNEMFETSMCRCKIIRIKETKCDYL